MKWFGLLLSLLGGSHALAAELTVTVSGIESAEGAIVLALYDRPKSFRKEEQSLQRLTLPAKTGEVSFVIGGLAAGRYAAIVYHDADSSGAMNRFLGMIPTEGYGLSTNPQVSGPPDFDDADFELIEGANAITIKLNY